MGAGVGLGGAGVVSGGAGSQGRGRAWGGAGGFVIRGSSCSFFVLGPAREPGPRAGGGRRASCSGRAAWGGAGGPRFRRAGGFRAVARRGWGALPPVGTGPPPGTRGPARWWFSCGGSPRVGCSSAGGSRPAAGEGRDGLRPTAGRGTERGGCGGGS